jgi:hypothetical protein
MIKDLPTILTRENMFPNQLLSLILLTSSLSSNNLSLNILSERTSIKKLSESSKHISKTSIRPGK